MTLDIPPRIVRQRHIFCQQGMDATNLFRHPRGHAPHRKMGIRRRAQLTEGKGFPQIHCEKDASIKAIRDDVGCHLWIPVRQLFVGLCSRLHGGTVAGLEPGFPKPPWDGVTQPGSQYLRRLRHHTVTLELGITALVEYQVKRVGSVFQLA